jgi:3-deoxy-D-manno-octulosonic-acid transferase
MNKPRNSYTLGLWLLLPYIITHLLWRGRKQPEYLKNIAERFGLYKTKCNHPVIWLHAVSVGETRAVVNLVKQLQAHYPDNQLLLTHTTPTGRAASEQLFGAEVVRVYLPYDYPYAVKRFLKIFQPRIGILLETEIWFNLIHACHQQNIPLLLLNARMSAKSASRYARYPVLVESGLTELSAIAAQSTADSARLTTLGGKQISVMGNLKFDIEPSVEMLALGKLLRSRFGTNRRIFLAASTREGEEELLLEAVKSLQIINLLTVIVPRHPQRFDEVKDLLSRRNFRYQLRSTNQAISAETQVVLGDSMGEMFAYYAACDIAFIGGSLLPFGGQNLIEACAVGKPVLIGPHTFNFLQASQLAVANGAALLVRDSSALAQALQNLFQNPEKMAESGNAGLLFVEANRGATKLAMECIKRFLDIERK